MEAGLTAPTPGSAPGSPSEPTSGGHALIVVDVQVDFVSGSLAVGRGSDAATAISEVLPRLAAGGPAQLEGVRIDPVDRIVGTLDWHIDPGEHFAAEGEEPNYSTTWPVHCVADTAGAQPTPELNTEPIERWFRKGQYAAAYSGFEGVDEEGVGLGEWLRAEGIERLTVVGIATDHCVAATVRDGLAEGFAVTVLPGLCAAVDPASAEGVLEDLRAAGARIDGAGVGK